MKIWIGLYQFRQLGGLFTSDLEYRYELHTKLDKGHLVVETTPYGLEIFTKITHHMKLTSENAEWKYHSPINDFMLNYFNNMSMEELLKETEYHNWQVLFDLQLYSSDYE